MNYLLIIVYLFFISFDIVILNKYKVTVSDNIYIMHHLLMIFLAIIGISSAFRAGGSPAFQFK